MSRWAFWPGLRKYHDVREFYCIAALPHIHVLQIYFTFLLEHTFLFHVSLFGCKLWFYPAGIRHPCETKFDNHLQDLEHSNYTLNIPLIPTTPEEMEDMFRLCSHVRFKIPQQVRSRLVAGRSTFTIFDNVTMCLGSAKSFQSYIHPYFLNVTESCGCLNVFLLFRFFKGW